MIGIKEDGAPGAFWDTAAIEEIEARHGFGEGTTRMVVVGP